MCTVYVLLDNLVTALKYCCSFVGLIASIVLICKSLQKMNLLND